jgi:phosphonate transport system permease protein
MGAIFGANSAALADQARPSRHWLSARRVVGALVWSGVIAISWQAAEVRPGVFFHRETMHALWVFLSAAFPPDLSLDFLGVVFRAAGKTIATATTGTILSILIALPLGVLSTSTLWRRGALVSAEPNDYRRTLIGAASWLVRALLGFLRSIPELVWALLFVAAVGLGSLAGTLAVAVAYSGVLGRVYADVFENVDGQPLEALQATGATRMQVFLRGIWPQALPHLTSYTLYSFECCVRAAAVMGFVGAGGIGYEISLSMRLFEYDQVLTLIFTFLALLSLADAASKFLRRRLQPNSRNADDSHERQAVAIGKQGFSSGRLERLFSWPVLTMVLMASFVFSGFTADALTQGNMLAHIGRFVMAMFPPDFDLKFINGLGRLILQTIAISITGTWIGIALGALLALPATSSLIFPPTDSPGRISAIARIWQWVVFWTARLILNTLRSIPELVWVLVCILAVGIGPFAGTVAIGLHTAGVLGKLYAETMEEAPRRPIDALRSTGASPLQILLWGVWPQAKQLLGSYTVLRWEMNLRASTILGLVGGGGLGQAIYNNVQLGFYPRVATLVIIIYLLVISSDLLSDRLRGRAATAQELYEG